MSDRDLVLEYRAGGVDEAVAKIILVNNPGQRYSFGTLYPGEVEGEEFLFCRGYQQGIVGPAHCTISADDLGQFHIQNESGTVTEGPSVYETFINAETVKAGESRELKCGDIISLGVPLTKWPGNGPPPCPIYSVKERVTTSGGSDCDLKIDGTESEGSQQDDEGAESESPFDNDLILSKIVSYLPFEDLKNARLVSSKWVKEASRVLEKVGEVSFYFDVDYVNPRYSSRVFRYLKEMGGLKMRNVYILLATTERTQSQVLTNPSLVQNPLLFSKGEPGEKMVDDCRRLVQSSQDFLSLFLYIRIEREEDFRLFHLLLKELGPKLVELEVQGTLQFLPADLDLPAFPLLTNLRTFSHDVWLNSDLAQRWVGLLVPLLPLSLEHFFCSYDVKELFLQQLVNQGAPNLKGLQLPGDCAQSSSETIFSLLLTLPCPLTVLKFYYLKYRPGREGVALVESLLLRNAPSLTVLFLRVGSYGGNVLELRFPPFPNLLELEVECEPTSAVRVTWENDLDYGNQLPSLRKLTITPPKCWPGIEHADPIEDPILNSFFPPDPAEDLRCGTVRDLWVAALRDPSHPRYAAEEAAFTKRMDQIRKMFPNALNVKFHREE